MTFETPSIFLRFATNRHSLILEATCTNGYLIKLIYQNPTVNTVNQAGIHVQKQIIKAL